MYILKDFQEKAVKSLLDHTYEALEEHQSQIPILLEAPTGSGKTVMISHYLDRLIDELPNQPSIQNDVAFIWFAPNTLHIQSYNSLLEQFEDTHKINCLNLDNLSANPILNSNDLLFVNWSSVDNKKKIWRKENEQNTNLETLIENTKLDGTKIILLIDEAHLSAFSGPQAIAVRKLIEADVEVLITATGQKIKSQRKVFISRRKVIDAGIIKKGVRLNIGLDPEEQHSENVHIHLLRTAFAKKKELQKLYDNELGEGLINPLILVQLPSDNASLSSEDKSIRETLEGLLNTDYDVSTNNGRLAVWLSGERDKDHLEDINGLQDVLIFKQAIAQGWNCPRAAILVSYRNIQNADFGVQTVGRILRMPHLKHYNADDLNYGYVYTNIQTNQIKLVPSDTDYFNLQLANRRKDKGWVYNVINNATIVNDRPSKGVLTSVFEQKFFHIMEQRYGIKQLPDVDLFTKREKDEDDLAEIITENKQQLIENGWDLVVDDHQIRIPTNIEIDTYEVNAILISSDKIKDFAITTAEFGVMFDRYCYDNITRLNKSKSWKKLRQVLIQFAEYYLGVFEFEARKLFLFPQNNAILTQHIQQALELFDEWQKEKGNENKRVENFKWEVPEVRYYSEFFNRQYIDSHALDPFFETNTVSTPELKFKEFLIENEEAIEWWYKNGDSGKEHFAVPYTNVKNELALFFVDFIIKFKNQKIGLFDTKTKRSDINAPNKHNALLAYMENENTENAQRELIGGVIISEEISNVINWRYCNNRIEDTKDLKGWDYFNPAELNK
jgi:type III restriction enzyme